MAAVLSCTPKFVLIAQTAAVKLHFRPIILPARHRMVEDDRDLTGLVTDVPLPAAVTARSSLEPPLLDIVLLELLFQGSKSTRADLRSSPLPL